MGVPQKLGARPDVVTSGREGAAACPEPGPSQEVHASQQSRLLTLWGPEQSEQVGGLFKKY